MNEAEEIFENTVKITHDTELDLGAVGAVISSHEHEYVYCHDMVDNWMDKATPS